ncbi:neuropeptides capa receptor-like [Glandiceps talaboti]
MCTIVIGTIGNTMVCVVVTKCEKLRTAANFQLVSLAIADGLVCLFAAPIHFYRTLSVLRDSFNFEILGVGTPVCYLHVFSSRTSIVITIMTLTTLSIIRAMGVSRRFSKEAMIITIIILIAISYTVGIGFGLVWVINGESFMFCMSTELPEIGGIEASKGTTASFIVSSIVIVMCYGYICYKTRRHQNSVAPHLNTSQQQNNGPQRTDIATAKLSAILIFGFLAFFLPFVVYLRLVNNGTVSRDLTKLSFFLSLSYCGSMFNPIAYSLKSKQFRQALICCRKPDIVSPMVNTISPHLQTVNIVGMENVPGPSTRP